MRRTQTLLSDNLTQRPLLLRLLHILDTQASVDAPASMDVVVAVLVVPIIVEAITAHKAELQAILHGASPLTFLQRPRKKLHTSNRSSTTTAQARATCAEVMDDALQRWQAQMVHGQIDAASYSKRLQEMLACLTFAAMEVTRSKAVVGMLARGNATVAQGMLIAFWHTVFHPSKVWSKRILGLQQPYTLCIKCPSLANKVQSALTTWSLSCRSILQTMPGILQVRKALKAGRKAMASLTT